MRRIIHRWGGIVAFIILSVAIAAAFWISTNEQDRIERNSKRLSALIVTNRLAIQGNQETLKKLCGAAIALSVFWKGVRATTARSLHDYTLSRASRIANQEFVVELTKGIKSAEAVGNCGFKAG